MVKYSHDTNVSELFKKNIPWIFRVEISCNIDGSDMSVAVDKSEIISIVDNDINLLRWNAVRH